MKEIDEPFIDDRAYIEIDIPQESRWWTASFLEHMQRFWDSTIHELDYSSLVTEKKTVVKYEKRFDFNIDIPDRPIPGFSQRKI